MQYKQIQSNTYQYIIHANTCKYISIPTNTYHTYQYMHLCSSPNTNQIHTQYIPSMYLVCIELSIQTLEFNTNQYIQGKPLMVPEEGPQQIIAHRQEVGHDALPYSPCEHRQLMSAVLGARPPGPLHRTNVPIEGSDRVGHRRHTERIGGQLADDWPPVGLAGLEWGLLGVRAEPLCHVETPLSPQPV